MKKLSILLCELVLVASLTAQYNPPTETTTGRFIRYVKIDTQSDYNAQTIPSTVKQFDLAYLLAEELEILGATGIYVSDYCFVYAFVPGNLDDNSKLPVLGFIAHMDTSPEVRGTNVNPVIHENYRGGDIVLPGDTSLRIIPDRSPQLKNMIGDDIITSDGTTLLGADDKAGCAEIMTLLDVLKQNPQIKHGDISIVFTSDEEVGKGIDMLDYDLFGADFAYTVDAYSLGVINIETFNAREATITFFGNATHTSDAYNNMISSVYPAADFISKLPGDMLPETTRGREGFMHPYSITMTVEKSKIIILLRDFEIKGLDYMQEMIMKMMKETENSFPGISSEVVFREEYLNMYEVLKDYPELTENIFDAARQAGIEPHLVSLRGGTDGAVITFKGIPCPNIFSGFVNEHSKLEFTSRNSLEKTTESLVNLVGIFAEKAGN